MAQNDDDDLSPLDMRESDEPPPPPRKPKSGTKTAKTADGIEVKVKVPQEPKPQQQTATTEVEEGPPRELTPLELLAGGSGGVEIERIGPGSGPGWRGSKFKGREVEMGRCGRVPNDPRLFDAISERWGGGHYKFVGSVNGKRIEDAVKIPGAPKALTSNGESSEDDDDFDFLGIDPSAYDPTTLYGSPSATRTNGMGTYPGHDFRRMMVHPTDAQISEQERLRKENEELRRKYELAEQERRFEDRLQKLVPQQQGPDPFARMMELMQIQAKEAERERKERLEEERRRMERDEQRRRDEMAREDQRRRDEAAAEQKKRDEEYRRREEERKEDQRRRDEERKDALAKAEADARRREEERKEERDREEKRREDERRRDDKMFELMMSSKKDMSAQAKEFGAMVSLVKEIVSPEKAGPASELMETKELIETGAKALSEDIVPALAEVIGAWRGSAAASEAEEKLKIQAKVYEEKLEEYKRLVATNPALVAQAAALPANPHAPQQIPMAPVTNPAAVPPSGASNMLSNDQLGKVLDFAVEAFKNGNKARASVGPFIGFCKGAGIPLEAAREQVGLLPPNILAKLMRGFSAGLPDGPMKQQVVTAAEMLASDAGQVWFAEFAAILQGKEPPKADKAQPPTTEKTEPKA